MCDLTNQGITTQQQQQQQDTINEVILSHMRGDGDCNLGANYKLKLLGENHELGENYKLGENCWVKIMN